MGMSAARCQENVSEFQECLESGHPASCTLALLEVVVSITGSNCVRLTKVCVIVLPSHSKSALMYVCGSSVNYCNFLVCWMHTEKLLSLYRLPD